MLFGFEFPFLWSACSRLLFILFIRLFLLYILIWKNAFFKSRHMDVEPMDLEGEQFIFLKNIHE